MQAAIENVVIHAVEARLTDTSFMQESKALPCALLEFLHCSILNGVSGTGLRACRLEAILHTVITERAFACRVRALIITSNDAEGAGDDTVAAAIADVLLYVDRVIFSANNRSRWAGFMAGRMGTMLAYVTAHQPALSIEKGQSRSRWRHGDSAIAPGFGNLLIDEG